ncbi:MAG: UPF0176 protein [Flavobacteriaceae bacterium]|jgi:UPF0176 protein
MNQTKEDNKNYEIVLFYKYTDIPDVEAFKEDQIQKCRELVLTGRTIVAHEGINGTFEGARENIQKYIDWMNSQEKFSDIHWKRSGGIGSAFPKLSIKIRDEIVTLGLGDTDFSPEHTTGKKLSPETLHEWIHSDREFTIVDMRNAYEHIIGNFEGSVCPPMDSFKDLPELLSGLEHLRDKTVVTVCTGGIRCEKASGFLVNEGFSDVYQLDGGIVSYMEKYPNEDFKGKLYVFDNRVAIGFETDSEKHEILSQCSKCHAPNDVYVNCIYSMCDKQFLACDSCSEGCDRVGCPECTGIIGKIKQFFSKKQKLKAKKMR